MSGPCPDPRRREATGPPQVSVVVACIGRPATVRRCLAALLRHTRRPWHLIAVARSGPRRDRHLPGGRPRRRRLSPWISSLTPRPARPAPPGGPACREARGEFVALVGPGVVVTDAWLEQLVALAECEPGDRPGRADEQRRRPGPSCAADIPYADPAERLDAFARRCSDEGRGGWYKAERVSGQSPGHRAECNGRDVSPPQAPRRRALEPRRVPASASGSRRPGPARRASSPLRSGSDRGFADQKARIPCGRTSAGTGRTVGDDGTSDSVPSAPTRKTWIALAIGVELADDCCVTTWKKLPDGSSAIWKPPG